MARLSRPHLAGHILGIVLGVVHLTVLAIPTGGEDAGPPLWVLVVGAALGLSVIALLVRSWRYDAHTPRRVAGVLLVLAALGALPGMLVSGVGVALQLAAGTLVLLTIATLVLLFYPQAAPARQVTR